MPDPYARRIVAATDPTLIALRDLLGNPGGASFPKNPPGAPPDSDRSPQTNEQSPLNKAQINP